MLCILRYTCYMELYDILAEHYDELMSHFDYAAWSDVFVHLTAGHEITSVVDLACGTGALTAELVRRGYDTIGVDANADMLSRAYERELDTLWLMQPLEELDLYGTVDAAVCCLDGFNHFPDLRAVEQALSRVKLFLNPQGILLFDMLAPQHFDNIDGQAFINQNQDCFTAWECRIDGAHCHYDFTVFKRLGEQWRKFNCTHRQLMIAPNDIEKMLQQLGFTVLWHDFQGGGPKRMFCLAKLP